VCCFVNSPDFGHVENKNIHDFWFFEMHYETLLGRERVEYIKEVLSGKKL